MGAAAVKESRNPQQNPSNPDMSCEACRVRFTVLKRKKNCCECARQYCTHCAPKIKSGTARRCERCQVLVSGDFDRQDLQDYKVKELRQFLVKRRVPVDGCREKNDLIDVLMQYSNNAQYRLEVEANERRAQQLQALARQSSITTTRVPDPPSYDSIIRDQAQANSQAQAGDQAQPDSDDIIIVDDHYSAEADTAAAPPSARPPSNAAASSGGQQPQHPTGQAGSGQSHCDSRTGSASGQTGVPLFGSVPTGAQQYGDIIRTVIGLSGQVIADVVGQQTAFTGQTAGRTTEHGAAGTASSASTNSSQPAGATNQQSNAMPEAMDTSEQPVDTGASQTGTNNSQSGDSDRHAQRLSDSAQASPATDRRRFSLADVPTEDDIKTLTTRQLKELLGRHFVDYKGCVEKHELVARVSRLWQENRRNQEAADVINNPTDDASAPEAGSTEICKICMDAVVNCVLLDCGHMLTCTTCGKQLSECPICRQYIVRVVHVFKS